VCRPGQPFIKGHPKITGGNNPLDWFPEELNWSGLRDAPTSLSEEHRINGDPPFNSATALGH